MSHRAKGFGIVGESGSGKSTVLRASCQRLMVMQRGRVVELVRSADLAAQRVNDACTQGSIQAAGGFPRTVNST